MAWIFTGIALIYLVAFLLMCLMVREGGYPPPEPPKKNPVAAYFRECFSLKFYRWFFLGIACNEASTVCRTMFNLLFAKNTLSLEQYGNIMSINAVISFCVLIPMGFLVDRFHPLRTYLAGGMLVIAANLFGFFFVNDYRTFFVAAVMIALVYVVQTASKLPMFVALLPQASYGQFSSANAMVVSVFLIFANFGGGIFIYLLGYRARTVRPDPRLSVLDSSRRTQGICAAGCRVSRGSGAQLLAELKRSDAIIPAVGADEIRAVDEAELRGDVGDGQVSLAEQTARLLHFQVHVFRLRQQSAAKQNVPAMSECNILLSGSPE